MINPVEELPKKEKEKLHVHDSILVSQQTFPCLQLLFCHPLSLMSTGAGGV
jgi:hypothetical protein